MFEITMLPARQGDCLWIEYGDENRPSIILIDGGMGETSAAIKSLIDKRRTGDELVHIELIVVTHIDTDHINGVIKLLEDKDLPISIGDIWFNGRPQMEDMFSDILGENQGDELSELLASRQLVWNNETNGSPIFMGGNGAPAKVVLDGGMSCHIVGPPKDRLRRLAKDWLDVFDGKEMAASGPADLLGRKDEWPPVWKTEKIHDSSVANGSSISLVLEHKNKWVFLPGDAHVDDMEAGLKRLAEDLGGSLPEFKVFKLSHHCSVNNISEELMGMVGAENYLVSTDGTTHKHPDYQALLRIIKWTPLAPHFIFNYSTEKTRLWLDNKDELAAEYRQYTAEGPSLQQNGWYTLKL